jgi:hypothetical protein
MVALIVKLASVTLDIKRLWLPPTIQSLMIKLLNLFSVEKGSTRPSLLTQKIKLCRDKLVNAGKFKEIGNNVL